MTQLCFLCLFAENHPEEQCRPFPVKCCCCSKGLRDKRVEGTAGRARRRHPSLVPFLWAVWEPRPLSYQSKQNISHCAEHPIHPTPVAVFASKSCVNDRLLFPLCLLGLISSRPPGPWEELFRKHLQLGSQPQSLPCSYYLSTLNAAGSFCSFIGLLFYLKQVY